MSYRDIDAIEHTVDVEAESLYEAVGEAVRRFPEIDFEGHPRGPDCAFRVQVQPQTPVSDTVSLNQVAARRCSPVSQLEPEELALEKHKTEYRSMRIVNSWYCSHEYRRRLPETSNSPRAKSMLTARLAD